MGPETQSRHGSLEVVAVARPYSKKILGTTFPPLKLGGLQVVDLSSATIRVDGKDVVADGLLGAGMMDLCNAVFDPIAPALLVPPLGTPDGAFLESKAAADHIALPFPKAWPTVKLTKIRAFSRTWDHLATRPPSGIQLTISAGGKTIYQETKAEGESHEVKLP